MVKSSYSHRITIFYFLNLAVICAILFDLWEGNLSTRIIQVWIDWYFVSWWMMVEDRTVLFDILFVAVRWWQATGSRGSPHWRIGETLGCVENICTPLILSFLHVPLTIPRSPRASTSQWFAQTKLKNKKYSWRVPFGGFLLLLLCPQEEEKEFLLQGQCCVKFIHAALGQPNTPLTCFNWGHLFIKRDLRFFSRGEETSQLLSWTTRST